MTLTEKLRLIARVFDENNIPFAGRRYTLTEGDFNELKAADPFARFHGSQIYGFQLIHPHCPTCKKAKYE